MFLKTVQNGGGSEDSDLTTLLSDNQVTITLTNNTHRTLFLLIESSSSMSQYVYNRADIKSYSGFDSYEVIEQYGFTADNYGCSRLLRLKNCGSTVSVTTGSDQYGTSRKVLLAIN